MTRALGPEVPQQPPEPLGNSGLSAGEIRDLQILRESKAQGMGIQESVPQTEFTRWLLPGLVGAPSDQEVAEEQPRDPLLAPKKTDEEILRAVSKEPPADPIRITNNYRYALPK